MKSKCYFKLWSNKLVVNANFFQSGNIMDACYLSAWYKLNINSQKSLLTLMERTKRPFTMHLYKLVFISLESLGEVKQQIGYTQISCSSKTVSDSSLGVLLVCFNQGTLQLTTEAK